MQDNMQQMLTNTIDNLRVAMQSQNIVSQPIRMDDGTVLIPLSKITIGFASGGGEYSTTQDVQTQFAGGGGGGLSVVPMGFVVSKLGQHEYQQLNIKEKDSKWQDFIMATIKLLVPAK